MPTEEVISFFYKCIDLLGRIGSTIRGTRSMIVLIAAAPSMIGDDFILDTCYAVDAFNNSRGADEDMVLGATEEELKTGQLVANTTRGRSIV